MAKKQKPEDLEEVTASTEPTEPTEPTENGAGAEGGGQELVSVRLLCSRAGVGFSQNRGQIIEVSASEAESIIAAGQAEAV